MPSEILKLHLGCFDQATEGWINTDITPHLWVARIPGLTGLLFRIGRLSRERLEQYNRGVFRHLIYLDVSKRFLYGDGTFDFVFPCHMLEHLFVHKAQACVAEIFRILKLGGICRVVVPALYKIVSDYNPVYSELFLKTIFECHRNSKNAHHWHYNAKSLLRLLRNAGFYEGYQWAYRQGRCPDLELLDNRADESLFIEAIK